MSDASGMGAPVAIGGVGGSGTRVVAEIIRELGFHIGDDLNESSDNLLFTLLFKHRDVLDCDEALFATLYGIFRQRMTTGSTRVLPVDLRRWLLDTARAGQHDTAWLQDRIEVLVRQPAIVSGRRWAWKEPNTHRVIERIAGLEPGLRYIHVARNGLDMAFSENQNQLRLWGEAVLGDRFEDSPRGSLAFWCWAHARIQQVGSALGDRFHFLRFDDLCGNPEAELRRLVRFLQVDPPGQVIQAMAARVRSPASMGRYRGSCAAALFDSADISYVRALGFRVDC